MAGYKKLSTVFASMAIAEKQEQDKKDLENEYKNGRKYPIFNNSMVSLTITSCSYYIYLHQSYYSH
jgi:hypothetical protein